MYVFVKSIEYKFNNDENKTLKPLFRDTILIFIGIVLADYFIKQTNPIINENPNIFMDNPSF
jgi:hypothetical protein